MEAFPRYVKENRFSFFFCWRPFGKHFEGLTNCLFVLHKWILSLPRAGPTGRPAYPIHPPPRDEFSTSESWPNADLFSLPRLFSSFWCERKKKEKKKVQGNVLMQATREPSELLVHEAGHLTRRWGERHMHRELQSSFIYFRFHFSKCAGDDRISQDRC